MDKHIIGNRLIETAKYNLIYDIGAGILLGTDNIEKRSPVFCILFYFLLQIFREQIAAGSFTCSNVTLQLILAATQVKADGGIGQGKHFLH